MTDRLSVFEQASSSANGSETGAKGDELDALIRLSAKRITSGEAILDVPEAPESAWGEDHRCLWAKGEPFILCGPDGVGKTTVAQQVALRQAGIIDTPLFGLPVEPVDGVVFYLACDRPAQVLRSFRRMVTEYEREELRKRLVIWRGPLPFDLTRDPEGLVTLARHVDAGSLIADSLKDIATDLSKDETGSRVNTAHQAVVAEGIPYMGLHHQRKQQQGAGKPRQLSDVYGSRWITAGAGSVVMLWGEPGDAVIELNHLKQPDEEVGPLTVVHDHVAGVSRLDRPADAWSVLRDSPRGATAVLVAAVIYQKSDPTRNQIEKARRQLEGLVKKGKAHKEPGSKGGQGDSREESLYFLTTKGSTSPAVENDEEGF